MWKGIVEYRELLMWKGIKIKQSTNKLEYIFWEQIKPLMNLFLPCSISSTFLGPHTIVFISLSSNNITSFVWYGGLLPTVVVADDASLLNKLQILGSTKIWVI